MQTLLAVAFGEAHRPRGVDGHHEIAPEEAVFVQCLLLQQGFHQPMLELLQGFVGQPTQYPVHGVQVQ